MARLLICVVLAGCWTADPKPVTTPPPPPAPVARPRQPGLDWPLLIGKPEAEARRAVTRLLELEETADLAAHGLEILARDQRTDTIFIHIQPETVGTNKATYRGPLFRGVTATMTRDQIVELLGPPDERGASDLWIKYRRPEAQIHFQFTGDQIYMITLMRPDWTPGS